MGDLFGSGKQKSKTKMQADPHTIAIQQWLLPLLMMRMAQGGGKQQLFGQFRGMLPDTLPDGYGPRATPLPPINRRMIEHYPDMPFDQLQFGGQSSPTPGMSDAFMQWLRSIQ